jgi:transcriptional regulator with XRE-family HTH domain
MEDKWSPVGLAERRALLGLSQAELGALLVPPVSRPAVSTWELGTRRPQDPMSVLARLAEVEQLFLDLLGDFDELIEHISEVRDSPTVNIWVYARNEDLWAADKGAAKRRVPASMHRRAAAWAALMAREDFGAAVILRLRPGPPA